MGSKPKNASILKKPNFQPMYPTKSNGCQTWTFTKDNVEKLSSKTERAIERVMLGIELKDNKRNS